MALVQCLTCGEKMTEEKGRAILWCKKCNGTYIKVLKDDEEE